MNDIDVFEADLDGQDLRIAIVQARFNEEHCQALPPVPPSARKQKAAPALLPITCSSTLAANAT